MRDLRVGRRWTQSELARQLGLSQNRLSEIERGAGSFTAEQFLAILTLFNVTTDHFVDTRPHPDVVFQNALARLGADHLRETEALPSERLREVEAAVREVLVAPESARLITALAPVLIHNADHFRLSHLAFDLLEIGLANRLGWVLENTLAAIAEDLPHANRKRRSAYRRAEVVLGAALSALHDLWTSRGGQRLPDVLDVSIRSKETLAEVQRTSSALSKRWGVVSELTPTHFAEALRGARASD